MKLKIKNIRCHLEKEIDLGSGGIVLASGTSGIGKSTICKAIMFGLFDTESKIATFGQTKCQVVLEDDDYVITRSKGPCKLVLYDKKNDIGYEGDVAQEIINNHYGHFFQTTSYIAQNSENSFITMKPTEKLEFLEKLAFEKDNLSEIKIRCQGKIKSTNNELVKATTRVESFREEFSVLTKPAKVPCPVKSEDTIEKARQKNIKYQKKFAKTKADIEKTQKEINETKIYLIKRENKLENIRKLKEKIGQIEGSIESLDFLGDEHIEILSNRLKRFLDSRELVELKKKYQTDSSRLKEMEQKEKEQWEEQVEKLHSSLWEEYSEMDCKELIVDYQKFAQDVSRLNFLKNQDPFDVEGFEKKKKELVKLKKELKEKEELFRKLKLQEECYDCPSCQAKLRFQDDELVLFDQPIDTEENIKQSDIDRLNLAVTKLEKVVREGESTLEKYKQNCQEIKDIENSYEELQDENELKETLEYIQNYRREQKANESKLKQLESTDWHSSSYKIFAKQVEKEKEKLDLLKQTTTELEDIDEEELREELQEQKRNKGMFERYKVELDQLNSELEEENNELKKNYKEEKNLKELEKKVTDLTNNLQELCEKMNKLEGLLGKIERYEKYKEELAIYTEKSKKLRLLEQEEQKWQTAHAAALKMKDVIQQAESLVLENYIQSINAHAQEYLNTFFPDHPIDARLSAYKTTKDKKKTKPQINLEIDYRGMEADLSMLSGGEHARVVLAFTLALAEMTNSRFIMLDEATSSLDQESTSVVMEGIRKNFPDRLILVIAHQVVSGDFDRQIVL